MANTINYNVKSCKPLNLGHEYDHKSTIVVFSGFKKQDADSTVYFKLKTGNHNWLIPLVDMSWLVTQPMTMDAGVWDGQIMEYTEDMVLIGNSDMFEVTIKESIEAGAEYEVHDPELDLWAAKLEQLYNNIEGKLERGELKGEKGDTGERGPQGEQGPKGDTGDRGADAPPYDDTWLRESEAERDKTVADVKADFRNLETRLKSGKLEDAELHLGFYLDADGDLCQKEGV